MNNRQVETTVKNFYKEFLPAETHQVEEALQEVLAKNLSTRQTLEYLYKKCIESRFIPLKKQRDDGVYYPMQRTKAWFEERKRIPSTVSGSRPAGWWFDIQSFEKYKDHLDYVHNGKKQHFDKDALARMRYGVKFEDHALMTFLEWGVSKLKSNMYVYETGFQRNTKYDFLGASPDGLVTEIFAGIIIGVRDSVKFDNQKDYLLCYIDTDGLKDTLIIEGDACLKTGMASSFDAKDTKTLNELEAMQIDTPQGWSTARCIGTRAKGAKHSILEIKCPQKMYSNIPAYYLMQLHMECHAYGLRDAYFVVWNRLKENERLRVWKLRFNDGFWQSFLTIVNAFRSLRQDGSRGAPWVNFEPLFWHFKKTYGKVGTWKPFVKPFHEPREYALNRPYANALNKVPEDAAQ